MSYISAITKGDDVIVWERDETGRHEVIYRAPYYFYVKDHNGAYETIFGDRVSKVDFATARQYYETKKDYKEDDVELFESDISPEMRILSSKYYGKPAPKLHITFFDIEVNYDPEIGFASTKNPYAPINSISLVHEWSKELIVITVPPIEGWTEERLLKEVNEAVPGVPIPSEYKTRFIICNSEKDLLIQFIAELDDSDIVCGWHSDLFDWPYIARRIEKILGKNALRYLSFPGAEMPAFREIESMGQTSETLDLSGRLTADYLKLYRKYEPSEHGSYKLSSIEEEVGLGLPKLEYEGTLHELYRKRFPFFIRYNIRDSEILHGFEKKLGYVELANQMYHISCGLFRHVGGTLKLAEHAIINHCHHNLKKIVPDSKPPMEDRQIEGAFVLEPKIGLHEWIGLIDVSSLYPSSIRAINISPETLRGQFDKEVLAAEEIAKGSAVELTLNLETGETVTNTADGWREWLVERKWAVSGYGTVFDQNEQGIIPAVVADWYNKRIQLQKNEEQSQKMGDNEKAKYYDRLQYVYKIKMNSLYGALSNLYFRFYDLRMAESTTGTGRVILKHECAKVNELLTGIYDMFGEAVIAGDTDSCYFKTFAQNREEAVQVADAVAEKINVSFKEFVGETFLCNLGYDDVIKVTRDLISDRGIFVEKKRYILHIVDKKGVLSDSMKIMGLDTKKTTLPKPIASKLNKFIEEFLKGRPWADIAQEIVVYKDQLWNTDKVMSIGLPKGVKGIEKYTAEYKKFGINARLPGHVAASIHYNLCLKLYNDKISIPITSGMKIKVFYLTQKYGKFKSVALPTDLEVVPQWFLDNFRIDFDAHIERLVDKPLENILGAIGKKSPTRQDLFLDTVFEF